MAGLAPELRSWPQHHQRSASVMFCRVERHHSRTEGDTLKTRIASMGDRLTFDPPGITVAVSDLLGDLDSGFTDEPG